MSLSHFQKSRVIFKVSFVKLLSSILFLLIPCQTYAQQSIGGSLIGTVLDPSDAVVAGASIVLKQNATGQLRETSTDANGKFAFTTLPTGQYLLRIEYDKFKTIDISDLMITVGAQKTLDIKLQLDSTEEVLTIESSSESIEVSRSSQNLLINSQQVSNLPVNGRNFKDFIALSPNVFPARSPESATFGNSISISGQRTYDTLLNIDGADFVNPFFSEPTGGTRPPFTISLESVQEFQVITNGASAEYGRTTAGIINVVTKSGGNDFHGTGFLFFRNKELTANDAFNRPSTDFTQYQFGGNIGGFIVRNRAFFFTALDIQRRKDLFVANFGPGLESFLPTLQGRDDARQDATVALGKLDLILNSTNTLNYRVNYSNFELTKRGGGNTIGIGLDHFGKENPVTQSHVTQLLSNLSPRFISEFRFQYLRENRRVIASNGLPEVRILQEGIVFGPNLFQNVPFNINDKFQTVEHISYTTSKHNIKFGAEVNITGVNEIFKGGVQGGYGFANINDFPNKPLFYFQIVGASGVSVEDATRFKARQKEFALFLQDSWRLTSKLTLNLGLRWEATNNPQPTRPNPSFPNTASVPNDYNNFSPRIGIAYKPSEKQVVRASFGSYYGRVPGIYLFQAFNTNGLTNGALFFFGNVPTVYPQTLSTSIPGLPLGSDVFFFDPEFELTRSDSFTLGYERELGKGFVTSVDLTISETKNVPFLQNLNLTDGSTDSTGRFIYNNTNPPFPDQGRVFKLTSLGFDDYRAISFSVRKRFSDRLQINSSYTLSRTRDTVSQEQPLFEVAQTNQFDPNADFGTSARDIRHRFNINTLIDFKKGFKASLIFTGLSGRPIDEVTGVDLNRDGNSGNDRIVGVNGQVIKRNSQRGPAFYSLDMRFSKILKASEKAEIELLIEAFNLFGSDNLASNGNTNDNFSVVRRPTPAGGNSLINAAGAPRQVQLGIRFHF